MMVKARIHSIIVAQYLRNIRNNYGISKMLYEVYTYSASYYTLGGFLQIIAKTSLSCGKSSLVDFQFFVEFAF